MQPAEHATHVRTAQQWIDLTPAWPDGTLLSNVPLTVMQRRIWFLATAGKFFEGLVVFATGVALPLMMKEFGLDATQKGILGAAPLFGILIGATALGGLSDRFGRKRIFIIEMVLFVAFLILLTLSRTFWEVALSLFGVGLALGCDYPTAHVVISESIPSSCRGRLVLGAFAFQAVGALFGTAVGFWILYTSPELSAWRWIYATAIVPALLVIAGRFFITRSGPWLAARGQLAAAEAELTRLLRRKPLYPQQVSLAPPKASPETASRSGYAALFSPTNRRATILASVPWFLQDLGTYGIGIFTPTILAAAVGHESDHPRNVADIIHNDMLAAKGAALLDTLLIVGIIAAVLLADRIGRIPLQIAGFIGCAVGLLLAALSISATGPAQTWLLFGGFMLFNFMTNLGPNAQTYLLAGEVFPTALRGKGAGFAASFAKIGAVMTAFLFPMLLKDVGTQTLLGILIFTSLVGAAITWLFRIETAGVDLETLRDMSSAPSPCSSRSASAAAIPQVDPVG